MSIICFEGPSAVGKTTTASWLAEAEGAAVVSEVNAIYERPRDEHRDWYLERQVDRWSSAVLNRRTHPLVVLDGDPFQPLWYGWALDSDWSSRLEELAGFYRTRLLQGAIRFPARYYIFAATEDELRERMRSDGVRRRRNFEKHLGLIEPQRRYFSAMNGFSRDRVVFVDQRPVATTAATIAVSSRSARDDDQPLELFEKLVEWLHTTPPA